MSAHARTPTRRAWLVAAVLSTLACDEWLGPGTDQRVRGSLYSAAPLASAMAALKAQAGDPLRVFKMVVFSDRLVVQVLSKRRSDALDQFVYREGKVTGPIPVELKGEGTLDDNVFPLEEARIAAIPELVQRAAAASGVEDALVTKIVVKRDLPEAKDVRFRVTVAGPRREAVVVADWTGQLVGP